MDLEWDEKALKLTLQEVRGRSATADKNGKFSNSSHYCLCSEKHLRDRILSARTSLVKRTHSKELAFGSKFGLETR